MAKTIGYIVLYDGRHPMHWSVREARLVIGRYVTSYPTRRAALHAGHLSANAWDDPRDLFQIKRLAGLP